MRLRRALQAPLQTSPASSNNSNSGVIQHLPSRRVLFVRATSSAERWGWWQRSTAPSSQPTVVRLLWFSIGVLASLTIYSSTQLVMKHDFATFDSGPSHHEKSPWHQRWSLSWPWSFPFFGGSGGGGGGGGLMTEKRLQRLVDRTVGRRIPLTFWSPPEREVDIVKKTNRGVAHVPRKIVSAKARHIVGARDVNRVDTLLVGKSCIRRQSRTQRTLLSEWDCVDCGVPPASSSCPSLYTSRNHCPRLKPRGRCPPLEPGLDLDLPLPRSSSVPQPSVGFGPGTLFHHSAGLSYQYETADCTVSNCFDLDRCISSAQEGAPLTVHPHGPHDSFGFDMLKRVAKDYPDLVRVVLNQTKACLFVVFSELFDDSPAKLYRQKGWNDGRNHLIFHSMTMFETLAQDIRNGDNPYHASANFHFAALASNTLTDAHVRRGYDVLLPLQQQWCRPVEWDDLELHRPRKWLLTFKGTVKDPSPVYYHHRWMAGEFWHDEPDVLVDISCRLTAKAGQPLSGYESEESPESFGQLLLNSTFVFCPGGNGMTSFRFTEALSADAIPVVTSQLPLPYEPELDWSDCVVKVSEARIVDLPRLLRAMPLGQVQRRQRTCAKLFRAAIGRTQENGVWKNDRWYQAIVMTLRLWKQRVRGAWKQREAARRQWKRRGNYVA